MDIVKPTNLSEPEISDRFLWRYVDSEKLFDFVINKQMHLSRLDLFEDPLEGLDLQTKRSMMVQNISNDENLIRMHPIKSRVELDKWQHGIYTSCWYMPENANESLAMWNLYSNDSGFAIKIKLSSIIESFLTGLNEYQNDTELVNYYYGKVSYSSYMEIYNLAGNGENILTCMLKDPGYEHEKEVRFVMLRNTRDEAIPERKSIRINLEAPPLNDLQIIANPDMGKFTFDLFKEKLSDLGFELQKSRIITRKVANKLIK